MWIFLKDSFMSIVAHRDRPDDLLVRARKKGDIQWVFPEAVEQHTPRADYSYRATIPRARVAEVLMEQVRAIDYDDFKNQVADHSRHDAFQCLIRHNMGCNSTAAKCGSRFSERLQCMFRRNMGCNTVRKQIRNYS